MRCALGLLACALLPSCELVFKLNDPGPSDTFTPDVVRGRFVTNTVIPNAQFENEIVSLPTPGSLMVRIDGAQDLTEVPIAADGSFEFERSQPDYVIETAAEGTVFEISESSAELSIGAGFAGRFDATPVLGDTPVLLPGAFTSSRVVATVGQFTATTIAPDVFDWRDASATGGIAQGLLDSDKHDQVFILEYSPGKFTTGQLAIGHSGKLTSAFAMVGGQPFDLNSISVTSTAVPNGCVHVTADLENLVERLTEAAPPATDAAFTKNWAVVAVPAKEIGVLGQNILAGAAINDADDFIVEADAPYFDPFIDHDPLAVGSASVKTLLNLPNATEKAIFASFTVVTEAPPGDECEPAVVASNAAFANDPVLGGIPLVTNEQKVPIQRPGSTVLTWETDGGDVDFFEVQLREVTVLDGRVVLEPVRNFRTREPRVAISEALLRTNRRYLLTLSLRTGYPGAAAGDYITFGPTVTITSTNSVMFVAQ